MSKEPNCEGLWTRKFSCGPELCKKVKATKKKADLEGTKTKRETRQEPTSQASELEGTITDNKRKKQ